MATTPVVVKIENNEGIKKIAITAPPAIAENVIDKKILQQIFAVSHKSESLSDLGSFKHQKSEFESLEQLMLKLPTGIPL